MIMRGSNVRQSAEEEEREREEVEEEEAAGRPRLLEIYPTASSLRLTGSLSLSPTPRAITLSAPIDYANYTPLWDCLDGRAPRTLSSVNRFMRLITDCMLISRLSLLPLHIHTYTRSFDLTFAHARYVYANWSRVAFIFNGSGVDRDDVDDDDDDGDFAVIPSDRSSGFWLIID